MTTIQNPVGTPKIEDYLPPPGRKGHGGVPQKPVCFLDFRARQGANAAGGIVSDEDLKKFYQK